jgi:hypothetical protein
MRNLIPALFTAIILLSSCSKKTSNTSNNTSVTPSYVGTYTGTDSIETYNGSTLLSTNVIANSFVVVESSLTGKNSYLLNFQGNDTVQSNFASGTISIFGATAPTIFNFTGTYSGKTINYYFEFINSVNQKVYGKYSKQ